MEETQRFAKLIVMETAGGKTTYWLGEDYSTAVVVSGVEPNDAQGMAARTIKTAEAIGMLMGALLEVHSSIMQGPTTTLPSIDMSDLFTQLSRVDQKLREEVHLTYP